MNSWLTAIVTAGLLTAPPTYGSDVQPSQGAGWTCELPARVEGPIDASLPGFGRIWFAYVRGGEGARVGVAWVREVDTDRLHWDESARVWRVEGSDETLEEPPKDPLDLPDALDDMPRYPRPEHVYREGEYVGMAVLASAGIEATGFLEGIGPRSGRACPLNQLGYFAGEWYAPLMLIRPRMGVAVAKFSLTGWGAPVMMLPDEWPISVWIFPTGNRTDLFRLVFYTEPHDLPEFMGGIQRARLDYVRILESETADTHTVYVRPNRPRRIHELRHQVVRLGPQRYDLLLERDTVPKEQQPAPDDIIHVPDLIKGGSAKAIKIAAIQPNSSRAAVPLAGNRMQLVWLEELYLDRERTQPPVFRLVEAHLDDRSWSSPRVLFEHGRWDYRSLAATAFHVADEEYVLALWRGENGCLAYTVGPQSGEWSEPATTTLIVGQENWVISYEQGFTLVTKMNGNLYWCHFKLTRGTATTRPR